MILEAMEPLAIELELLRALETPGLRLTPGRALMARVVARDASGRGMLSIAGASVAARLPQHVRAGDHLRLTVREISAERAVLSMGETVPAPLDALPAAALPGGGRVRVEEQEGSAQRPGDPARVVTLRYEGVALGAVDLRFELDDSGLRLVAALTAGEPLDRANAAAKELRDALSRATQRSVTVTLRPRRDPVDVYA